MLTLITYFVLYFCAILIGYVVGLSKIKVLAASKAFDQLVAKAAVTVCVAETIGSITYLFEKDSHNFMCQGSSLEELAQRLLEDKKINIAFVMQPDELVNKTYWFVNGKLLPVNSNES